MLLGEGTVPLRVKALYTKYKAKPSQLHNTRSVNVKKHTQSFNIYYVSEMVYEQLFTNFFPNL